MSISLEYDQDYRKSSLRIGLGMALWVGIALEE